LLEEVPRKIKIIINPHAGGGKGRKLFPQIRRKLLDRKMSFHLQFAESANHVTQLCRQALSEGYNFIVSCGGDGTHHQAIQAMAGSRHILGLMPIGTGNDFPAQLGIPEDLDFCCDLLLKGKIRKIDLIQVDSGEYVAGVGGIGFDSEVNAIANRISRFLRGRAAYVLPVLLKTLTYQPKEISLQLDHEFLQGRVLMVAFGNIKSYGKGMQITALAEPDDGLLDICWIDPVKMFRLYRFFPTVFSGDHLEMPEVRYFRSTSVRVESSIPLDFYGDGEFIARTPFTLRVVPRALKVLVP
jgi:YegS/Rv2252/BmrU family lipid kinase